MAMLMLGSGITSLVPTPHAVLTSSKGGGGDFDKGGDAHPKPRYLRNKMLILCCAQWHG